MRPIAVHGHDRPITKIKYNKDGDLLYSASKARASRVWFTETGELLGCFGVDDQESKQKSHQGTVWDFDISHDSKKFLTASADFTCILWDGYTGKDISTIKGISVIRSCGISKCSNIVFFTSSNAFNEISTLSVVDLRVPEQIQGKSSIMSYQKAPNQEESITSAIWGPLEQSIICGYDSGYLQMVDSRTGKLLITTRPHKDIITDIQMHKDNTMLITASKDCTAKLIDSIELNEFTTYDSERPINSGSISPTQPHVILAGGQEAKDVTISKSSGKFDSRLYHMIYAEEFGQIKGHFGPVNSLQFSPDGRGFTSGGEDGYFRIHIFDPDYYQIDAKIF